MFCLLLSSLPHEEHHLKAQKDETGNHREPKFVFTKEQKEEEEEEEQKMLKEKHEFLEFFYTFKEKIHTFKNKLTTIDISLIIILSLILTYLIEKILMRFVMIISLAFNYDRYIRNIIRKELKNK